MRLADDQLDAAWIHFLDHYEGDEADVDEEFDDWLAGELADREHDRHERRIDNQG